MLFWLSIPTSTDKHIVKLFHIAIGAWNLFLRGGVFKNLTPLKLSHLLHVALGVNLTSLKRLESIGANGLVCQGWVVDWAPTDLQNDPNGVVVSTPLLTTCAPVALPGFEPKGRGHVKSVRSTPLKPDRLSLSCKADKCSNTGAEGLSMLPTHDASPCNCWLN